MGDTEVVKIVDKLQKIRALLQPMKPGQAVALQIERAGQLQYLAFEWGD